MTVRRLLRAMLLWLATVFIPLAVSAGPGEKQGKLVHVADTRQLQGFNLYFANLYNTNRLLFTIEVVLITVGMGIALGVIMDKVVSLIGLDLSSRSVKE